MPGCLDTPVPSCKVATLHIFTPSRRQTMRLPRTDLGHNNGRLANGFYEYASSVWSPIASSTSINKLQVMQNAALRTATGCTQDTNIQHLHDETLTLPIHEHLQLHASQYKQKNTTSITSPTQTHNILQHSKAKKNHYF